MQPRRFTQLDVFANHALQGNALAVVLDGEGISDAAIPDFARWTNLSETTPSCCHPPPKAQPVAPTTEYDHPLRASWPLPAIPPCSCQAWLNAGGMPRQARHVVIQECAKGLITIVCLLWAAMRARMAWHLPRRRCCAVKCPPRCKRRCWPPWELKADDLIAAQWLDNGSRWMGLLMRHIDSLPRAQPNAVALRALGVKAGLCAIHPQGNSAGDAEPVLEVRGITLTAHGIAPKTPPPAA